MTRKMQNLEHNFFFVQSLNFQWEDPRLEDPAPFHSCTRLVFNNIWIAGHHKFYRVLANRYTDSLRNDINSINIKPSNTNPNDIYPTVT